MKASLVLSALISCVLFISISGKHPILIVPGLMGSQLEVQIESNTVICNTRNTYVPFWIDLKLLICSDYLKLQFKNGRFSNASASHVRVPGFGRTEQVECLFGEWHNCKYNYFREFVDFFVEKGYTRGEDIRAAPYDWRLSPYELKERGYFSNVMNLIEDMSKEERVTLVAHSYGGVVMQYFLAEVASKEWKNTYIKAFVPLGSPFGGAKKVLKGLKNGILLYEFFGDDILIGLKWVIKGIFRTLATPYYLAPQSTVFEEFTRDYYEDLFKNKLEYGWEQYTATQEKYTSDAPGVRTYCMYGYGVSGKKDQVKYSSVFAWPEGVHQPSKPEDYGDGTVDKVSLEVCNKWSKQSDRLIIEGMGHMQIVSNRMVLNRIYYIATRS